MLELLKKEGISMIGLVTKLAGGASMFAGGGPMQIGLSNYNAVVAALSSAGISVAAADVGGTKGRRVTLNCETGGLTIEVIGQPPRMI
jgi:chemotaxis protein CheD